MSAPARKLLEVAFEALADSGVNYRGSDTGVFVGSGQSWENEVAELPYVAVSCSRRVVPISSLTASPLFF